MKEFILKSFIIDIVWEEFIQNFKENYVSNDGNLYRGAFELDFVEPDITTFASFPCFCEVEDDDFNNSWKISIKGVKEMLAEIFFPHTPKELKKIYSELQDCFKNKIIGNDFKIMSNRLVIPISIFFNGYEFIFKRTESFLDIPLKQMIMVFKHRTPESFSDYISDTINSKLRNFSKQDLLKLFTLECNKC